MRSFPSVLFGLCCCALVASRVDGAKYSHPVDPSAEEDGRLNMSQLANKYGYPMETHTVLTEDGYVLTVYRIPYGKNCGPGEKSKVPVLVQHGLLSSCYDFLIQGPRKGLAYLLADRCYDVWLGNNRGNGESKQHIWMTPKQKEFWNFSWHEMGKYDLPAMIDYILKVTGQPGVHYIGHSQGTTQFFVFGALRPEYHSKIRSMHALSPVVYMNHLTSPLVRVLTVLEKALTKILDLMGVHELFPSQTFLNFLGSEVCHNKYPNLQGVCCNVLFLLCGFDEPQLNKTILPAIIGHTPAGAAVKQLLHYSQGIRSGEFKQFDYGPIGNLKVYKSFFAPKYDVKKIDVPIAFYYGANDYLAALEDVRRLGKELPNLIEDYLVPYKQFSHLDFLFAVDIKHLVYYRLLEVLDKY